MPFFLVAYLIISIAPAQATCIASHTKAALHTSKRDHYEYLLDGNLDNLKMLTRRLTDNSVSRMNIEANSEMDQNDQKNLARLSQIYDRTHKERIVALKDLLKLIVTQSLQERELIVPTKFTELLGMIRQVLGPTLSKEPRLVRILANLDSNFWQQRGIERDSDMTKADIANLEELAIQENELRIQYWKQLFEITEAMPLTSGLSN